MSKGLNDPIPFDGWAVGEVDGNTGVPSVPGVDGGVVGGNGGFDGGLVGGGLVGGGVLEFTVTTKDFVELAPKLSVAFIESVYEPTADGVHEKFPLSELICAPLGGLISENVTESPSGSVAFAVKEICAPSVIVRSAIAPITGGLLDEPGGGFPVVIAQVNPLTRALVLEQGATAPAIAIPRLAQFCAFVSPATGDPAIFPALWGTIKFGACSG